MIHLDTNYLIGLLIKGSQAGEVDRWLAAGQTLATSAIAWTEFLNGPVTSLEVSRVEAELYSHRLCRLDSRRRYWPIFMQQDRAAA